MSRTISIPNVELKFDQLLAVIRQLNEPERIRIARVLTETQMDSRLSQLISELAMTRPANEVSDEEIDAEIRACGEKSSQK